MTQRDFWKDLFQRRPELAPPGYEETVRAMGYQARPTPPPEPAPECNIEF